MKRNVSSLVGILAGVGTLVPAILVPELRFLIVPAFLVLLPSLIFGMR